jgi:hypothetical protein
VRERDDELRKRARVTEQEAPFAMRACYTIGKANGYLPLVRVSVNHNERFDRCKKYKRIYDTEKVVLGLEPTG